MYFHKILTWLLFSQQLTEAHGRLVQWGHIVSFSCYTNSPLPLSDETCCLNGTRKGTVSELAWLHGNYFYILTFAITRWPKILFNKAKVLHVKSQSHVCPGRKVKMCRSSYSGEFVRRHQLKEKLWLGYTLGGIYLFYWHGLVLLRGKHYCKSILKFFFLITSIPRWYFLFFILMGVVSSRMTLPPSTGHYGSLNGLMKRFNFQ